MIMNNMSTDKLVVNKEIRPVIFPKFKSTPKFPVLNCATCHLSWVMKFNPDVIKQYGIPEKETTISWDTYELGNVWAGN